MSLGPPADEGQPRRLILWDLAAAARRAELVLPPAVESFGPVRTGRWHLIRYTPDGRYVFADSYSPRCSGGGRRRDRSTGRGDRGAGGPGLLDGGALVVHSPGDPAIGYWDVATGRRVDLWDLRPAPEPAAGSRGCPGRRAVSVSPIPRPRSGPAGRPVVPAPGPGVGLAVRAIVRFSVGPEPPASRPGRHSTPDSGPGAGRVRSSLSERPVGGRGGPRRRGAGVGAARRPAVGPRVRLRGGGVRRRVAGVRAAAKGERSA